MTINYRDGIAIGQLVFFIPCAFTATYLAFRHGFRGLAGWLFLILFSLLRVVGAIFRLIAISHPTKQVITGEIICTSVGLSPLALILVALLSRVNMLTSSGLPPNIFRILHLASIVGVILGIVGGTNSINKGSFRANGEAEASVVIFAVVFVATLLILCMLTSFRSRIENGEKRLLLCVAICCALYLVRLIYSMTSSLGHVRSFNLVVGNPTIYLCMAVIEEFLIVIICLGFGLTLRQIPKGQSVEHGNNYDMPRRHQGTTRHQQLASNSTGDSSEPMQPPYQQPRRMRRGPIAMLIGSGVDAYRNRQTRA